MVNKLQNRIRGGWSGQISEVRPWLFLSGARAIRPLKLQSLGFTHIINATVELPQMTMEGIDTISVRILDAATTTLQPHLHAIADRIAVIKQTGGKLLVHCVAGVSRSSALILAYLVKHERMSLKEAFLDMRQVRPVVRPNSNFFRQLIEFETEELGDRSVTLLNIPDSTMVIPDVCEDELRLINSRSWATMVKDRRYFRNQFA